MSERNVKALAEAQASILVFGHPEAYRAIAFDPTNDGVLVPWAALVGTLEGALSGREQPPIVQQDELRSGVLEPPSSEQALTGLREVLSKLRHLVEEVK